jgi:alkylation response protein AidB-like acyl-CoA dehydrogenase
VALDADPRETTVSVGIAVAALEAAIELCQSKTAAYNATPLREQQLPQFQIGKARALLEASRDTLHRAGEAAYDEVAGSGGLLSPEVKIRLQLAVAFAAEATAKAVRFVNTVAGTSSIRMGQPFQRHFRDVHTLLQHTSKNSARYGSAGRMMLGLEPDPNLFWLNL